MTIQELKAEMDRINQGCGKYSPHEYTCSKKIGLCPVCQKEKETIKKVSLMWADEMLKEIDETLFIFTETITETTREIYNKKKRIFQQIKSLMEKDAN